MATVTFDPEALDPKMESERWRDRVAGIGFVFHILLFLGATAYGVIKNQISLPTVTVKTVDTWITLLAFQVSIVVGVSCFLTIIGHFLVRWCPRMMIHFVNLGLVTALAAWAVLVGIYSNIITATFYGILSIIVLIVYLYNLSDVGITTALLGHVNHFAQKYSSLFAVVLLTVVVTNIYSSFATVGIIATFSLLGLEYIALTTLIAIYYLFSFWWSSQVILNVMRTVVAGTVCLDYERRYRKYSDQSDERTDDKAQQNYVWQSFRMSMSHFGGICYGSILVGPVSFIRGMFGIAFKLVKLSDELTVQIKETLGRLGRNFNYLAFNHVAVKGEPYKVAANNTWDLMAAGHVGQVADDSSIGSFTFFFSTLVGLMTAFSDLSFKVVFYDFKISECMASFVGFFVLGLVIPGLYLSIIDAGTTALLVCVADEPQKLENSDTSLYNVISEKYPNVLAKQEQQNIDQED